jgi:thymidylate synthase
MKILAIVSGAYGQRHVANIRANGPSSWTVTTWTPPRILPMVIDEPEEFLPASLPEHDLLLAFQEDPRAAQLISDVAKLCHARAVIAPVDREEWMPRGLVQQVGGWLKKAGIASAFPKPLCALTEEAAAAGAAAPGHPPSPEIAEFARVFGRPTFTITCDPATHVITEVKVIRDAVCGCARHAAEKLVGTAADDAEQAAGLAHHHYPCMASMGVDSDFNDTLMHVSGNIMKQEIAKAVAPWKTVRQADPSGGAGA